MTAGDPHIPTRPAVSFATLVFHVLLLSGMVLIAGLTPVAAKDAVAEMPPLSTGFVRFSLAALALYLTRLIRRDRDLKARAPIERRDVWRFLVAAMFCVPINQFTFLGGVNLANASHAGLFYALNPVIVYVITLLLGIARRSRRMAVAAVLAFAGAGVVGWDGLQFGDDKRFFMGDVLLFGAVSSWAGYTIAVAPLAARYGAIRTTSIVLLLGSVLYSPSLLVDGHLLDFTSFSVRALGGFAFITFATGYLNYMLWNVALARIDINRLSVAVNGAPLISVVAAYYWRDEPITAWLLVGAVLILVAITLANWDKIRALRANRPGRPAVMPIERPPMSSGPKRS